MKDEALRLLHARNEAYLQPAMNRQIAKAYLAASDEAITKRTWTDVFKAIISTKKGPTQARWKIAERETAFNLIRNLVVIETQATHLLAVLNAGTVSTNVHLRRLHNFALDMNWLPWPILAKKLWPAVRYKVKRGITLEEHQKIIARERNPEHKAFYELCWHLGGSQSNIASLHAEDINWEDGTLFYRRKKTAVPALIRFGKDAAATLSALPNTGPLFPSFIRIQEKHRALYFRRRCISVGVSGVSLHCYRYAWAERARKAGMPERFAQEALGHNSAAVHRAYAKQAQVRVPSLEDYEKKILPFPEAKAV